LSTDKNIFRFLLVSLNINAILQGTTISPRRRKLNAMTDGLGLGGVYDTTLSRIKGQGGEESRLGMATLMWISHSERPLKADELCHALGVEIGSADLDGDNAPSIGTLLACCQGLVTVDKEASTVRLIHFTLQEYLQAHPEHFDRPHAAIAETCLSYLSSRQVKGLSGNPSHDICSIPFVVDSPPLDWKRSFSDWIYFIVYSGTPFLEYSSLHWGTHPRRGLSDCPKQLAVKLFDECSNHVSIQILFYPKEWRYANKYTNDYKPSLFGSLHCDSSFGIVEIVASLVEVEGCNINQTDWRGSTLLMRAAEKGQERVVEILLGRDDVNPDQPNDEGQTPLHSAASNRHERVVKILLGRDDVNPDNPDEDGQTPIYCAARGRHE